VEASGLPLDVERQAFLDETRRDVEAALASSRKGRVEPDRRREAVRLAARRAATRWTGKKPQVLVMIADS
jgi:ribonuclease J